MKGEFIVLLMSFLGAMSQTSKLLKVPRIYNALITSDENLQPSQAYPALAPVVHGIQYSLPSFVSTGAYRTTVIPNQVQYSNGRSFAYSVKENYYHYNFVETGQPFKFDIPKIPEEKSEYEPPSLFRPVMPVDQVQHQFVDHNVYFESSPAQQDEGSQKPTLKTINSPVGTAQFRPPSGFDTSLLKSNTIPKNDYAGDEANKEPRPASTTPENQDNHLQSDLSDFPTLNEFVKNNKPNDPSIVDVPPPPLPVGRKSDTKKEEFPPAAVPFI